MIDTQLAKLTEKAEQQDSVIKKLKAQLDKVLKFCREQHKPFMEGASLPCACHDCEMKQKVIVIISEP